MNYNGRQDIGTFNKGRLEFYDGRQEFPCSVDLGTNRIRGLIEEGEHIDIWHIPVYAKR